MEGIIVVQTGRRHHGGLSLTGIYNKNSFFLLRTVFFIPVMIPCNKVCHKGSFNREKKWKILQ